MTWIRARLACCACVAGLLGGAVSPSLAQDSGTPAHADAAETSLFAITYRAGPSWRQGVPMAEQGLLEHFYFIRNLHRSGTVLLAGPYGDDGGLIVLRAESLDAVEAIMAADPAVVSGLFVGEAKPFVARFSPEGWPAG